MSAKGVHDTENIAYLVLAGLGIGVGLLNYVGTGEASVLLLVFSFLVVGAVGYFIGGRGGGI